MMRNVLVIGVLFIFIYFKMFIGIFNKEELSPRRSHSLNDTLIHPELLHFNITGQQIYNLALAIDPQISILKQQDIFMKIQKPHEISQKSLQSDKCQKYQDQLNLESVQQENLVQQERTINENLYEQQESSIMQEVADQIMNIARNKKSGKRAFGLQRDKNLRLKNRQKNVLYTTSEEKVIDMRKNLIEYNGFEYDQIWEYIQNQILQQVQQNSEQNEEMRNEQKILENKAVISLIKGVESIFDIKIAQTMLDNFGYSNNQMEIAESLYQKIGKNENKVEGLMFYYIVLLQQIVNNKQLLIDIGQNQPDQTESDKSLYGTIHAFLYNINQHFDSKSISQFLEFENQVISQVKDFTECMETKDCQICKLNFLIQIEPIIFKQKISQSELTQTFIAFLRAQESLIRYIELLEFETHSNDSKFIVKVVYAIGLIISVVASLYILDYYTKRQIEFDVDKREEKVRSKLKQMEEKLKEKDRIEQEKLEKEGKSEELKFKGFVKKSMQKDPKVDQGKSKINTEGQELVQLLNQIKLKDD
eukprot:403369186